MNFEKNNKNQKVNKRLKSETMKILISNLKGKALLNIAMKNRIDKLVSVYSTYNETSLLDQYITKENIKVETENSIEACKHLSEVVRRAIKEGDEIYVASDGNFIGSMLNFVANKEGADFIYYYFNNQAIQMPRLSLNLSKTKMKILETLEESEQTAILIGKKVSISRSMVYKHLNAVMEEGLAGQTKQYETDAGKMIII